MVLVKKSYDFVHHLAFTYLIYHKNVLNIKAVHWLKKPFKYIKCFYWKYKIIFRWHVIRKWNILNITLKILFAKHVLQILGLIDFYAGPYVKFPYIQPKVFKCFLHANFVEYLGLGLGFTVSILSLRFGFIVYDLGLGFRI